MARLPDTETAAADLLAACGQLIRRIRAESNNLELTWSQTATLTRLTSSGPMSIADLARAESVKPQSMGVSLAALESDGLVERTPHPSDGRQFLFSLTALGVDAHRRVRQSKQAWLASALSGLSNDEREELARAVKVIARLADATPRES